MGNGREGLRPTTQSVHCTAPGEDGRPGVRGLPAQVAVVDLSGRACSVS